MRESKPRAAPALRAALAFGAEPARFGCFLSPMRRPPPSASNAGRAPDRRGRSSAHADGPPRGDGARKPRSVLRGGAGRPNGDGAALRALLERIDGRGYPAYRDIRGAWTLPGFTLAVRRVQGDPFAAPSSVAVLLEARDADFPASATATGARRTGLSCLLARTFAAQAGRLGRTRETGHGRSGEIAMTDPGQVVLRQTAVQVAADGAVEARFTVGLPAKGRRVRGRDAARLLLETVSSLVTSSLVSRAHDPADVALHAETNEDAEFLRAQLSERGLVAFVANGAVLPRRSGSDDRPMALADAVPFQAPPEFEVELDRLNGPPLRGMGLPAGVTLLAGGGYHGKSTLLDAVARGVYNHRPGDGREHVVADSTATRVQAEDGRAVTGVDISAFVGTLPGGAGTRRFSTSNASGSTSQAAAVVEALEAGARLLLIDEDTSATNFMIRDRRMQALVASGDEPITPFVDRARNLFEDCGASVLIVIGGSGDYLDVADRVIGMANYVPRDLTRRAREVARELPTGRLEETATVRWPSKRRAPDPNSVRPEAGRRHVAVKAFGTDQLDFGRERIVLGGVGQIVSAAQLRSVGLGLARARDWMGGGRTVEAMLDALRESLQSGGLDSLARERRGDLAEPRMQEVAAALNRLRTLRVTEPSSEAEPS